MGRIMSVVNDLILRRDRDATQRESLSQTLRTLRADGLRQTTDFERVNTKLMEAQRKVGLAEANDRALKQQIRSAELAARALKEEMVKMKMLVGQTRASCANEVRKRERVIEGMKKHVGEGGRARGSGKAVGVVNVVVSAGVGEERENEGGSLGVDDTAYELRMETNEFLTELARGLSEENESMGGLLRRTVETLRSLSGCEKEEGEEGMVVRMETGYESLAGEMDFVIDHLQHLLTNPSFVPLEEVEVREEEIIRLREGWEKMESRWREAVEMMEGWRKRLARSGQTVNLEELKMGLMLSPLRPQNRPDAGQGFLLSTLMEEGDTQADIDAMDDSGIPDHDIQEPEFDEDDDMSESSLFEEEPLDEEPLNEEPSEELTEEQPEHDNTYATASSLSPGPPPRLSPLRETNARVNQGTPSPQREGFSTIEEENTYDLLQLETSSPAKTRPKSVKSTPKNQNIIPSSPGILCVAQKSSNVSQRSPRKISNPTPKPSRQAVPKLQQTPSSRLPRPRDNPPSQQSPLTMATIAAKLAATEREADAARVRAKLKAAKLNRSKPTATEPTKLMPPLEKPREAEDGEGEEEPVKADGNRKRKAGRTQGGRANRRRSTLSPWELESLITGGVGGGK
ncbi:Afadin and alpha-actinin-binding-domain-containing protein [Amylocarpus encephaloides]|uniref:Afadin and alpha-actinin-binding-domain-containing protein n=1 Tax=Amylocarpus encephaloides TaxID=45428 RepID=A0A9P7YG78_9HELO|nr:Afadin and alpha-actinin-binding-domain-containing protein [Amylocarpus encephaloides]